MRFAPLHLHTGLSFQDGYGRCDQVADRAVELGHSCCAVTDHGNVFAHVMFQKEMVKRGIRPIFGCEFYIADDLRDRTKEIEAAGTIGIPHVTVLARNQKGYEHLLKLSRISWEEGFYYKPRIDWDELARWQEGLIVLSGCSGGYPTRILLSQGYEAMAEWLAKWRHRFEHFYVELNPAPAYTEALPATYQLWRAACELQIPAVLTHDSHFPRPEHHRAQDLMLCVGIGKRLSEASDKFRIPSYQYMCSAEELFTRTDLVLRAPSDNRWTMGDADIIQAIENSQAIADLCHVEIPKAKPVAFPDVPEEKTSSQVLHEWIWAGLQKRWGEGSLQLADGRLMREVDFTQEAVDLDAVLRRYWDRAMHEWQILTQKEFCDYMLAVIDVCRWMKEQDALVMCRGSAGGCLILWLCGASETDPIRFDLSFERFYDYTRTSPPDVDIDFEQRYRNAAIQYIYSKYGAECCSQLAALSQLKAKAAVQDVAFAYGIPRSEFGPLADALDSSDADVDRQLHQVTDPKALAVLEKYREEFSILPDLIKQYRQASIHAAGVVISSEPLDKVIGVVVGQDKQVVAAVDKKGAEAIDLLKMDFLSVASLDVVAGAVRRIGKPMSWLYTLPINDERALAVANNGFLAGVFQLDGASAARVSKQIGIHDFEDVVAASALCRPGPGDWVDIYRKNKEDWHHFATYVGRFHPFAQEVIKKTYGILLYQEQVMRLARDLAAFEWTDVHKLRKGVQDKLGLDPQTGPAWRQEWEGKFVHGCVENRVRPDEAAFWWQSVESHGGYSFNRSHCVTYALIGYWMLYLKAHYPAAFYESYLALETDQVKMKRLIAEFRAIGGRIDLLRLDSLTQTFSSPEPGVLCGGLTNIKGIGPATANKIIENGPYSSWDDFFDRIPKGVSKKLRSTGLGGEAVDPKEVIELAPWMPVRKLGPAEERFRADPSVIAIRDLPPQKQDGVVIIGYVSLKGAHKERQVFVIEDETGSVQARISDWSEATIGLQMKEIKVSDFVALIGWWSGTAMFIKGVQLLSRRETSAKAD